MNRAARAAAGCLTGPGARKRASDLAGLRRYETEIRVWRGRCRAKGCASRYGVTRITIDTRDVRRIARLAVVECVQCGRQWWRVSDDTPATRQGYLSVLVTLLVPSDQKRVIYRRNGGVHASGDDTVEIRNATHGQLMDAAAEWRRRNGLLLGRLDRARTRKREADAAITRELMDGMRARDEARAERARIAREEEAAAAAREARGEA